MRRHKDIVNTHGKRGNVKRRGIESHNQHNLVSHPATLDARLRDAAKKAFRLMGEN